MLIIIKKRSGTNGWDYPGNPRLFNNPFHDPGDRTQLIVTNNSGKTLAELSALVSYPIVEYTRPLPTSKYRTMVTMIELIILIGDNAYPKVFRAAYPDSTQIGDDTALYFIESRRYAVDNIIDVADQETAVTLDYFITANYITLADKARIIKGVQI